MRSINRARKGATWPRRGTKRYRDYWGSLSYLLHGIEQEVADLSRRVAALEAERDAEYDFEYVQHPERVAS